MSSNIQEKMILYKHSVLILRILPSEFIVNSKIGYNPILTYITLHTSLPVFPSLIVFLHKLHASIESKETELTVIME